MDGSDYNPGPRSPDRCTRAADRTAVIQSIIMVAVMIVVVLGGVLLAATFCPWMLDSGESWLAYAATRQ